MRIHRLKLVIALLAPLVRAPAQTTFPTTPDLKQILERLDRLETENRDLREQVRQLREQVGPPVPTAAEAKPALEERTDAAPVAQAKATIEERMEIEEHRTAELAQVTVETSQKFPVRLTGMALVNLFSNSRFNSGFDNPAVASPLPGNAGGGATWRQTILGLDYQGPETIWNGKIHGSVFLDFFNGTITGLNNVLRVRTASLGVDWKTRSLTLAQDKPIISPRNPDSLAQVGIPPLAGAGNLWWWNPQVKFEQRIALGEQAGINAQIGVIETSEREAGVPANFATTLARVRPGFEGRFNFFGNLGEGHRFEVAPGFHLSNTRVAFSSVPSRVFSTDWMISPIRPIEFTGFFFTGQNVAHFDTTGIRQGFAIIGPGNVLPVHSRGGWAQLKVIATGRLSFNLMAGQQDDRNSDLRIGLGAGGPSGGIAKNLQWGGNSFYKLAPNVLVSFEILQTRTTYLMLGRRLNNHYDLAFAYLF
jgi:hypothetical protein